MNININNYDLKVPGKTLLSNTCVTLSHHHKYGLIGLNGSGKTSLLKDLMNIDLSGGGVYTKFLVQQDIIGENDNEDLTVYDYIFNTNTELCDTLKKLDNLDENDDNYLHDYESIQSQLLALQHDKQVAIISKILYGLGFNNITQNYYISQFSGGWKMRISLARALYLQPDLLLLDEPTNHLDLEATIWLTQYLQSIKSTLVVVSHNQTLLNSVCNCVVLLDTHTKQLVYYKGNYDSFYTMRMQQQQKLHTDWDKLMKSIKHLKTTADKENAIAKSNLQKPGAPYEPKITFLSPTQLRSENPLVLNNVSFTYSPDQPPTLNDIDINVGTNTRITIVGKNGSGKSTFLHLLGGSHTPTSGEIIKDNRLKLGFYHQHTTDTFDPESTPILAILNVNKDLSQFEARKMLGSIGLHGSLHNNKLHTLSGGQKARVAFCTIIASQPHILLLDEPTNHLDIETINALILAINNFKGGVVMVTHDEKLITNTNCRLWVCENNTITPFKGDYEDYKGTFL